MSPAPAVLAVLVLQLGSATTKETAYARVPLAQSMARDAALLKAVKERNARLESNDEIKRKDEAWIADARYPLRKAIVGAPCSERVRQLVASDTLVVEAFVADQKGALVCATRETSDYWQGDEAKWRVPVKEGREVLVEEPALDVSTGTYAVQLSVPVLEGSSRLGSLTLTLKIPRSLTR